MQSREVFYGIELRRDEVTTGEGGREGERGVVLLVLGGRGSPRERLKFEYAEPGRGLDIGGRSRCAMLSGIQRRGKMRNESVRRQLVATVRVANRSSSDSVPLCPSDSAYSQGRG